MKNIVKLFTEAGHTAELATLRLNASVSEWIDDSDQFYNHIRVTSAQHSIIVPNDGWYIANVLLTLKVEPYE